MTKPSYEIKLRCHVCNFAICLIGLSILTFFSIGMMVDIICLERKEDKTMVMRGATVFDTKLVGV